MRSRISNERRCGGRRLRREDDPERATLAYIVGNVAASADQGAVVLLTIDGVWLATKGYADDIHTEGFQALKEMIAF